MRLLEVQDHGEFRLTDFISDNVPRYAILSHTWEGEEVTFKDLLDGSCKSKAGYAKIRFCGEQTARDGLRYFWMDTCCIDKSSSSELQEAINSMFRWYQDADRCYVYLADVSASDSEQTIKTPEISWEIAFRASRWFTRGWTLQELLAPASVQFFSKEGRQLGDKESLKRQVHEITGINVQALQGNPLRHFSVVQRFSWAEKRQTTRKEDAAYSLLGIFDVHMPLIYGEGREKALIRLRRKIRKTSESQSNHVPSIPSTDLGQVRRLVLTDANILNDAPYILNCSDQCTLPTQDSDQVRDVARRTQDQLSFSQPKDGEFEIHRRNRTLPQGSDFVKSNEVENLAPCRSIQEQTLGTVRSLVQRTQHVMIEEDSHLQEQIVHIYRELGKHQEQLQRLTQILTPYEKSPRDKSWASSKSDDSDHPIRRIESQESNELSIYAESDATDIFFDCISRFSQDDTDTSIERLSAMFSGSPDYSFEASSTFFPEQYTVVSMLPEAVVVVTVVELEQKDTHYLYKYFLIYGETPRNWRKVTVCATIIPTSQNSAFAGTASRDTLEISYRALPGSLKDQLEGILRQSCLFETITMLPLTITEAQAGHVSLNSEDIEVTEDLDEADIKVDRIVQDVEDIGCPKFVKSDVIVRSRYSPYIYIVQVGSRLYIEQRLPFAKAVVAGNNDLHEFFDDLRFFHSLRDCNSIVEFAGVVFSDTSQHLGSFLREYPALGRLSRIFDVAEQRGEELPWDIRETWAKQIIYAVSDLHSRGVLVGALTMCMIGIRADGSAVLIHEPFSAKEAYARYKKGFLAPELRDKPLNELSARDMSFRADVFQLGLILWLLAEHKWFPGNHLYCPRNACTNLPRYSCHEEHTDPIELPPCSKLEIPKKMDLVIGQCRRKDPTERMPARMLLDHFRENIVPSQINGIIANSSLKDVDRITFYCDECGAVIMDLYYHCSRCDQGDMDFCRNCVSQGVHCFVPEHRLTKRVMKNGIIMNLS